MVDRVLFLFLLTLTLGLALRAILNPAPPATAAERTLTEIARTVEKIRRIAEDPPSDCYQAMSALAEIRDQIARLAAQLDQLAALLAALQSGDAEPRRHAARPAEG